VLETSGTGERKYESPYLHETLRFYINTFSFGVLLTMLPKGARGRVEHIERSRDRILAVHASLHIPEVLKLCRCQRGEERDRESKEDKGE
jgi:hypothetical protein